MTSRAYKNGTCSRGMFVNLVWVTMGRKFEMILYLSLERRYHTLSCIVGMAIRFKYIPTCDLSLPRLLTNISL